jgi:hypothetical protein
MSRLTSSLPTPSFHMKITRSKPDHPDKPFLGASHGPIVWTLWVTCNERCKFRLGIWECLVPVHKVGREVSRRRFPRQFPGSRHKKQGCTSPESTSDVFVSKERCLYPERSRDRANWRTKRVRERRIMTLIIFPVDCFELHRHRLGGKAEIPLGPYCTFLHFGNNTCHLEIR